MELGDKVSKKALLISRGETDVMLHSSHFLYITVGIICPPPDQSNFLEVLNENMNKVDSISNEIYILGNLYLNTLIFSKTN